MKDQSVNVQGDSTRPRPARRVVAPVVVVVMSVLMTLLGGAIASPAQAAVTPLAPQAVNGTVGLPATSLALDVSSLVAPIAYSITGDPTPLAFDAATGIVSGTPSTPTAAPVVVTVTAADAANSVTAEITITVIAAPPVPGITPTSQTITGIVGAPIAATSSFTPTALTAPLAFALSGPLPSGLTMDLSTGIVTGTPSVLAAGLALTITATDSSASPIQVTSSLTVTITAGALSPAVQSPVVATAGTAITPTVSYPASAAYAYAVSPTLPTGLVVSPTTGAISGTPTSALAATTFTVEQHDALAPASILATATVSVTVNTVFPASPLSVAVTSGTPISPVISFGPTAAIATGLVAPITFAMNPAAPSGLSIDPNTGVISGSPTLAAASTHVVTATDVHGAKTTGTVNFVLAGVPALAPISQTVNAGVGVPFSTSPLTATGMTSPVKYAISPILSPGLTLNSTTGAVSGTPSSALVTGVYTITGTDALGATATATLVLTVAKVSLSAPVIGSVTPGSQPGSLIVFFSKPLQAPAGQTYTVKVFDANGITLIQSVPATSSPVTILGLIPGETYQVVVVANASGAFDMIESSPKAGTAAVSKNAVTATASTTQGVVPATVRPQAGTTLAATAAQAGFVLATGTQASTAIKVFATKAPSSKPKKGPKVRVPASAYVSIVVPGVTLKGRQPINVKVGRLWALLGNAKAKKGSLTLPSFAPTKPGKFRIRIGATPQTFVYLTLVVGPRV